MKMIKKFLLAIMIAIPACAFAQSVKVGTVDVEAIIPLMPEYEAAQTQLAESSKKYEAEYQTLQEEMQKIYAEYQKLADDPNTPQSIKERRLQDIQDRNKRAEQFAQTADQDLRQKQAQLMQPVQEKMMQAINSVGSENGYIMILPVGVAAYTSPDVVDVTPLVKTKLGITK